MNPTFELACDLIRRPSVTPDDQGCQQLLARRLQPLGFDIEHLRFGEVDNLWARRGDAAPLFVFAGHTDVVPPGPAELWESDPFDPLVRDGMLYGRGAVDMKSSIAAMVTACERFLALNPGHRGSIGFLITSDEEGPATDGTVKVIEHLQSRSEAIDFCLVGEPSSTETIGDVIKNGRRGSISGDLTIHGVQGHIAYPHLAKNPIHLFAVAQKDLCEEVWDNGNEFFPPTSFQVVDLRAGVGAPNVTPGEVSARFNFRYSTEWTHEALQEKVQSVFDAHDIDYELNWHLSGKPFLTEPGKLIDAVQDCVTEMTGRPPEMSTGGGTSDGRFISPAGADVVELGPVNASIHKIDEHVSVDDVVTLTKMYRRVMELLLL